MASSVAETFIQVLPHLPEQTLKDLRRLLSEDLSHSDVERIGDLPPASTNSAERN